MRNVKFVDSRKMEPRPLMGSGSRWHTPSHRLPEAWSRGQPAAAAMSYGGVPGSVEDDSDDSDGEEEDDSGFELVLPSEDEEEEEADAVAADGNPAQDEAAVGATAPQLSPGREFATEATAAEANPSVPTPSEPKPRYTSHVPALLTSRINLKQQRVLGRALCLGSRPFEQCPGACIHINQV